MFHSSTRLQCWRLGIGSPSSSCRRRQKGPYFQEQVLGCNVLWSKSCSSRYLLNWDDVKPFCYLSNKGIGMMAVEYCIALRVSIIIVHDLWQWLSWVVEAVLGRAHEKRASRHINKMFSNVYLLLILKPERSSRTGKERFTINGLTGLEFPKGDYVISDG